MKRLISMVDFVLENSESEVFDDTQLLDRINNYAHFIKQPLELWMFVHCDENGNVLEEPDYSEPTCENEIGNRDELIYQYQQAKERVLFEGFVERKTNYDIATLNHLSLKENRHQVKTDNCILDVKELKNKTIEHIIRYDLTLTQSAIKQIGL